MYVRMLWLRVTRIGDFGALFRTEKQTLSREWYPGILASWYVYTWLVCWYLGDTEYSEYILPGVSFPDRSSKQEPHKLDLQYYSMFPIYVPFFFFFLPFFLSFVLYIPCTVGQMVKKNSTYRLLIRGYTIKIPGRCTYVLKIVSTTRHRLSCRAFLFLF